MFYGPTKIFFFFNLTIAKLDLSCVWRRQIKLSLFFTKKRNVGKNKSRTILKLKCKLIKSDLLK